MLLLYIQSNRLPGLVCQVKEFLEQDDLGHVTQESLVFERFDGLQSCDRQLQLLLKQVDIVLVDDEQEGRQQVRLFCPGDPTGDHLNEGPADVETQLGSGVNDEREG